MTPEQRDKAKEVRNLLCLDDVCQFDKGCGCLDDIAQALKTAHLAGFHDGLLRAAAIAEKYLSAAAEVIRAEAGEEPKP